MYRKFIFIIFSIITTSNTESNVRDEDFVCGKYATKLLEMTGEISSLRVRIAEQDATNLQQDNQIVQMQNTVLQNKIHQMTFHQNITEQEQSMELKIKKIVESN